MFNTAFILPSNARAILFVALFCWCSLLVHAQETEYHISKATDEIVLDGELNETSWQNAQRLDDFAQTYPTDTAAAQTRTEVMLTFDDQNLYIAAICHDELDGKYVVQSMKRDFSFPATDAFAVFINPSTDQTNGLSFSVNPYGAQREGIVSNGGSFGVTTAWDNKWFSHVKRSGDKWVAEMAIPFKTLRYDQSNTEWLINFARNDLKRNERSTWIRVPQGFNVANFTYTAPLVWDEPAPKTGANVVLIPYVIGGAGFDYSENPTDIENLANAGIDAKIGVTTSLNLDLTVNPDFSQVEVDQQIINLERFNAFFPERRTFFTENSDLFGNFGFSRIRPFFSRRIGISGGEQIPILGGARLSGNVDENWRIGIMSMQTEGVGGENPVKSQNYSVAAVQRKVFSRSNIAAIVVNRQAFDKFSPVAKDYNTIVGADFNLASKNNYWRGKLFYHQSFKGGYEPDAYANASWLRYETSTVELEWNHEYVGEEYNADVGFLPRKGYFRLEPIAGYRIYTTDNKVVNNIKFRGYSSLYWNKDWEITDRVVKPNIALSFENSAWLEFFYRDVQTRLSEPFDPTRKWVTPLPADNYKYRSGGINFESNFRKNFYYTFGLEAGTFYNGNLLVLRGSVNYRFSPWGTFSVDVQRNEIRLPQPYQDGFPTLVGSKLDLSFTNNIFFTTFVQYNTQADNININSRLQWRFLPMSDLFIVYTDNYDQDFGRKNRAFVIKMNYWFGV